VYYLLRKNKALLKTLDEIPQKNAPCRKLFCDFLKMPRKADRIFYHSALIMYYTQIASM